MSETSEASDTYHDGTVAPPPQSLRHDVDPSLYADAGRAQKRRDLVARLRAHGDDLDQLAASIAAVSPPVGVIRRLEQVVAELGVIADALYQAECRGR